MPTATIETIRDRIIVLIEALTPTSLVGDRFRVSRDENMADFAEWVRSSPAASLRRFQVRSTGDAVDPEATNVTEARQETEIVVLVAYPQTNRYGGNAGRDRDDVIDEDWRKINYAIGIYGRANFSSTHDCIPLGATKSIDRLPGVDLLTISARYAYTLDTDG